MKQLGKVINQVTKFVQERVPFPLGEQIHEIVPGDQVRSRTGNTTPWPLEGSVYCCSIYGVAQSRTRLNFYFSPSCIREGNGNLVQCSCLENPRDGGVWWAAVYGVA